MPKSVTHVLGKSVTYVPGRTHLGLCRHRSFRWCYQNATACLQQHRGYRFAGFFEPLRHSVRVLIDGECCAVMTRQGLRRFHVGAGLNERRDEKVPEHMKRPIDRSALRVVRIGSGVRA